MARHGTGMLNWSRAQRLALSPGLRTGGARALWSTLDQLAAPASQLILSPLLLHRLGAVQFGMWVLALSALWSAPLLTRGMEIALLSCARLAEGERTPLRALVAVPLRTLVRASPLAAVVAMVAAWLLAAHDEVGAAVALSLATMALVVLTAVDAVMAGALKGVDRFRSAASAEFVGRVLSVGGIALLVSAGADAVAAVAVLALFIALKTALKTVAVWRLPDRTALPSGARVSASLENELRRIGAWSLLTVSGGIALYAYDRWVVAAVAGPSVVGHYAICSQYAQFSFALLSAAALPLIPWAARQRLAIDEAAARRRLRLVAAMATALTLAASGVALALGPTALSLWIGPDFAAANAALVFRLGLVTGLLALSIPASYILIGLGRTRRVGIVTVLAAAVLVLVTVIGAPASALDVASYKFFFAAVSMTLVAQLFALLRAPGGLTPAG